MKIKNKRTGVVFDVELIARDDNGYLDEREVLTFEGKPLTIKKFYDEFEDYNEPPKVDAETFSKTLYGQGLITEDELENILWYIHEDMIDVEGDL